MAHNKAEIVDALYDLLGYPRKQCIEIVESLVEIIKANLTSGDDLLISGFGKFCVREKGARRGRNPMTGEDVTLRPRRVVTFRCSTKLRDRVNGTGD